MKPRKEYIVRLPKDAEERRRAIAFVSEQMELTYGSRPPETTTPQELFIVLHDGSIIGSLGTHYGTDDAPLPFERLFRLDPRSFPLPYSRGKTIYYSRWAAVPRSCAGKIVWLAATEYAISRRMTTGIAMIKNFVEQQFLEFGCRWSPIPGAVIRPEEIAPTDRKYFFEGPAPYLCIGLLKEQISALPNIVEALKEKYGITTIVEL